MQLVIAEKPSVANDLAAVLPGSFKQHEGWWEGPEHLIAWAVGHMLELAEPEDYDPELKNWSLANLPILPEEFRRKPRQGQSNQLRLLKKLANRPEVESVVNACDAGREGELIFREVMAYTGADKPVYRLWLQSMTPKAIREAFAELQPGARFDGLGAAAYSRAEADWLIGMNATRGITKRLKGRKERGVWSAGRVQTPTLALLVHREVKVLAHVPVPFWRVKGSFDANGHAYDGQYRASRSGKDAEKLWQEDAAPAIAKACRGARTEVVETVSESTRAVPPLHSLTSLQKEANSRFGLSARRTLAAAQRLYQDHKVLTYPRTDSSCLPEDYRGHVESVLRTLAAQGAMEAAVAEPERAVAVGEAARQLLAEGLQNQKRNFNDAGVSDHFAIIPTGEMPRDELGGDDAKVFELVVRRFLGAFLGRSKWQKVVRETRIADPAADGGAHLFYTESNRMVEAGFQLVDRRPSASESLPDLGVAPGEVARGGVVEIEVEEDATRPPKRYTEAGLLKAMESASDIDLDAHDELDDDEVVQALKDKGLGTPATRADMIESLLAKGYAMRSGKTLRASAKGITLIDFLERIHADHLAKADLTAEMEFHLAQVERGDRVRDEYMSEVETSVRDLVERLRNFEYEDLYRGEEAVGKCPRDSFPVEEGLKGYRCTRPSRATRYKLTIRGAGKEATVPLDEVTELLRAAALGVEGVQAATPDVKRTNAYLELELAAAVESEPFRARAVAALQAAVPEGALKEPLALDEVEPDACGYTVWKEFRGRYINRPVATKLLEQRDSGPLEGFVSMRGESYAGRIRLDENDSLAFEPVKDFKGGDDDSRVAPELRSYPVDDSPFVPCPLGKGQIVETPTYFESSEDGGLKMPRTVCQREMTRDDLRPYFDPAIGHTDWIEDFISRKGRPFTARLVRKPNGRHTFEFKPREPRAPGAAKKTKRKATKKTGKKVTKKAAAKKGTAKSAKE